MFLIEFVSRRERVTDIKICTAEIKRTLVRQVPSTQFNRIFSGKEIYLHWTECEFLFLCDYLFTDFGFFGVMGGVERKMIGLENFISFSLSDFSFLWLYVQVNSLLIPNNIC